MTPALSLEECTATVDPVLAEVAIRNLLSNALRNGTTDALVKLTLRENVITVENQGRGFPEAIIRLIESTPTALPSEGGSGIGLATVMLTARVHGVSLVLENMPEGGARAILRLFEE